jgi:outer membrane protein OmpA-like peptidoglycan-associated protein
VFRNFENRITKAGYKTIFSGGPEQFNDYRFKYKHPVEKLKPNSLSSKIWYLSARRAAGGSDTYISILASPHSGGDGQRVRLIAVETKTMENRMVDATKMRASINETGKVALYGIYFDTDSAAIKNSSAPTMQEIAKLLRDNSRMKIIVVGHTDNQGGYDYNMDLSKRRAAAVAQALQTAYKISPSRLRSAGVGYLAPAGNNASEEGRALNRRVELVREK